MVMRTRAMGERAQLVHDAIISHMRPAVGRPMNRVTYATLAGEISAASDLAVPVVCIGGEVILHFGGFEQPVVVSWAENAGWPDHFSIQVRPDSAFNLGALVNWPANDLLPWRSYIGSPLVGVRVFARNGTPHVLELVFRDGRVLLGDGYGATFGDGDDLIVRAGDDTNLLNGWDVMWSSS